MTVKESAVAAHCGDAGLLARIRGGLKVAGLVAAALRATWARRSEPA